MNTGIIWQTINGWDAACTKFLNVNLGSPLLDAVMIFFTILGNGVAAALITAIVIWLNPETRKTFLKNFLTALGCMVLAGIFVQLIKLGVNRHRPLEHVAGLRVVWETAIWRSFPSGHTATAFAMAGYLAGKIKKYMWLFWAVAGLIALSRVYTGVHYPTDVIAGALVGIAAEKIVLSFQRKKERPLSRIKNPIDSTRLL